MEWLTNQFQGNASVEDSLVYGISRAARKACAGITFILFSFAASAQTAEQSIELGEVEVKAARIVHKTDGLLLYPSDAQKEASSSGYSVLQKLSLPNIRIDEDARNVSTIDNKGSVQLRINGIIVDQAEMLSLDPKSIRKIDFIDNPGVRYGDGVAYVCAVT